jgi:hypothetical protein
MRPFTNEVNHWVYSSIRFSMGTVAAVGVKVWYLVFIHKALVWVVYY